MTLRKRQRFALKGPIGPSYDVLPEDAEMVNQTNKVFGVEGGEGTAFTAKSWRGIEALGRQFGRELNGRLVHDDPLVKQIDALLGEDQATEPVIRMASNSRSSVVPGNQSGKYPQNFDPKRADSVFTNFRKRLAPREGGYANRDPKADPRGLTMKGMTQVTFDSLRKQGAVPSNYPLKVDQLSDSQIDFLYRKEFFDRYQVGRLEQVPGVAKAAPELAEQIFDAAVHHGGIDAGRWLQEALDEELGTNLQDKGGTYDGIIGSDTRRAVAQAVREGKITSVNNNIVAKRIEHMRKQSNFPHNPGWIPRAESFLIQSTP